MEYKKVLEKLQKEYRFSEFKELSCKDISKVYSVRYKKTPFVLKLHRDLDGYNREKITLASLAEKGMQVPEMVLWGIEGEREKIGYIVETYVPGKTLKEEFVHLDSRKKMQLMFEVGNILGKINTSMDLNQIEKSDLWRYGYDSAIEFPQYKWIDIYEKRILEWVERIRVNHESMETIKACSQKIMAAILKRDINTDLSLLHRDYGFRNIMIKDGKLSGVIDFEYSVPGDKYFDLSKIIFNDLNFETDTDLREAFFNGWSEVTKEEIDWDKIWIYLAIQGLGAIQWVDKQPEKIRRINQDYKKKGMSILLRACEKI